MTLSNASNRTQQDAIPNVCSAQHRAPQIYYSNADHVSDADDSETPISSSALSQVLQVSDARAIMDTPGILPADANQAKSIPRSRRAPARYYEDRLSDEEPLVDRTAVLDLHSKKTARMQKRLQKKEAKRVRSDVQSFLDFPHELLSLILSFLEPSDVFSLMRVSRATNDLIHENEHSIAESIISRRYWVLSQCFRRPFALSDVPKYALVAVLSSEWQTRLRTRDNPYQHIKQINPRECCTCMSCLLAWNNLNIILDLAHWQTNLDNREPLPIIPRGRYPEWNTELLARHADLVSNAMRSPLVYSRILQAHLRTTTRTIIRSSKWRKKGEKPNANKPRLYHLTDREAEAGTDEYLERSGPPNYQPLYMRDNYYSVEAFIPNRKWDKEQQRWFYYANSSTPHENDLSWLMKRYTPSTGGRTLRKPSTCR